MKVEENSILYVTKMEGGGVGSLQINIYPSQMEGGCMLPRRRYPPRHHPHDHRHIPHHFHYIKKPFVLS